MKILHNLETSRKLLAAFAIVLSLTALLGISALSRLSALNQSSLALSGKWLPQTMDALAKRNTTLLNQGSAPSPELELQQLKTLNTQLSRLLVSAIQSSQEETRQSEQLYQQARLITFSLLAMAICGGTLLALWVARSISRPLQQAMTVAERIAGGDLSTRIPP